jgi:hypothetical protein
VRRDGKYAEGVDKIAANCGNEAKQAVLSGKTTLSREEVANVAALPPEQQRQKVKEVVGNRKKPPRKKPAKQARHITLPKEPKALVRVLVEQLGRQEAARVHQELGKVLGTSETASTKT